MWSGCCAPRQGVYVVNFPAFLQVSFADASPTFVLAWESRQCNEPSHMNGDSVTRVAIGLGTRSSWCPTSAAALTVRAHALAATYCSQADAAQASHRT